MDIRYTVGLGEYKRMTTQELRDEFLIELFEGGALSLLFREVESIDDSGVAGGLLISPLKFRLAK